jgi:hypothetical protein
LRTFTGLRTVAGAKFLSHFAFRGVAQNCTILEETHEHKGRFQRGVRDDWRLPNGRLQSSSTLDQIDDQYDKSNYEQEVDQAAANVAEQPNKP